MPGIAGGARWSGAASDLETGILYVPSNTLAHAVTEKVAETSCRLCRGDCCG